VVDADAVPAWRWSLFTRRRASRRAPGDRAAEAAPEARPEACGLDLAAFLAAGHTLHTLLSGDPLFRPVEVLAPGPRPWRRHGQSSDSDDIAALERLYFRGDAAFDIVDELRGGWQLIKWRGAAVR
jgi:hypothetical protein